MGIAPARQRSRTHRQVQLIQRKKLQFKHLSSDLANRQMLSIDRVQEVFWFLQIGDKKLDIKMRCDQPSYQSHLDFGSVYIITKKHQDSHHNLQYLRRNPHRQQQKHPQHHRRHQLHHRHYYRWQPHHHRQPDHHHHWHRQKFDVTMSSTVLLTGGSGYVGYTVAKELAKLHFRVVLLDLRPPSGPQPAGITFIQVNNCPIGYFDKWYVIKLFCPQTFLVIKRYWLLVPMATG